MSKKLSKNLSTEKKVIKVGARASPLSKAQVLEVLEALKAYHPLIEFDTTFVLSHGDLDKAISLRDMGKTDFFTKEIDEMVLNGSVQCGIHSAKDLPDPLPPLLSLVALTQGLDPSDSLVFREGATLAKLPKGAAIATSSLRRENAVKSLRSDLNFIDLRGTIQERLDLLKAGKADGVVVAESALIRLKLAHLNRMRLPGETVPFQGQLAVIAREDDAEMHELFACLDSRR